MTRTAFVLAFLIAWLPQSARADGLAAIAASRRTSPARTQLQTQVVVHGDAVVQIGTPSSAGFWSEASSPTWKAHLPLPPTAIPTPTRALPDPGRAPHRTTRRPAPPIDAYRAARCDTTRRCVWSAHEPPGLIRTTVESAVRSHTAMARTFDPLVDPVLDATVTAAGTAAGTAVGIALYPALEVLERTLR